MVNVEEWLPSGLGAQGYVFRGPQGLECPGWCPES